MTSIPLRIATVGLLLYSVAAVLGSASASKPDKTLEALAPYRQWTRVNQRPLAVDIASAAD